MSSRKGEISFVVKIILALVILIVVGSILFLLTNRDFDDFQSMACYTSNRIKAMLPGKPKCAAPGALQPLRFCGRTKPEKIKLAGIGSEYWDKCNPEFEKNSGVDLVGAVRNCTMQQILDKVLNCWKMGGEGIFDSCSFLCYMAVVDVGDKSMDTSINDEKQLRTAHKIDIETNLGCRPNQVKGGSIIDPNKCTCNDVSNELADIYSGLTMHQALTVYYRNLVVNNYSKTGQDSDGYLVHCAKKGKDVTELSDKLLELNSPSESSISALISSSLDTEKEGCDDAVSKIASLLKSMRTYAQQVELEKKKVEAVLDKCVTSDKVVSEGGSPAAVKDKKEERVEFLMRETTKLTAAPPSIDAISQSDLQEFAKQTKTKDGRLYSREFGPEGVNNIEFIGGFRIGAGAMFEIAFCGGNSIDSGILSNDLCSTFDRSHVQLAIAGGGAGGVSRAGSPYCHLAGTLQKGAGSIGPLGISKWALGGVKDFCKGVFWKAAQPYQ